MMKRNVKQVLNMLVVLILAILALVSCTKKEATVDKQELKEVSSVDDVIDELVDDKIADMEEKMMAEHENAERVTDFLFTEKKDRGDITSIVTLANKDAGIKTFQFDALDLDEGYDDVVALTIDFDGVIIPKGGEDNVRESGDDIVITSGGIYVLKGTLNDKRIRVEKGLGPMTQIVLDGVKINTDKESAILTPKDCITQIHLAKGSVNEINSKSEDSIAKGSKRNGVIFSEEKLSFTGTGKLIIKSGFECSIESNDKLIFISGDYEINAKGDGIKAKNEVIFRDGNVEINSGDDAIRVTKNKNAYVYIENANMRVASNDKGINSDDEVLIVGGSLDFDTRGESIAGKVVNILGGKINLKSGNDAINTTDADQNKKDNQIGVYTRIIGGELNIDSAMDGIDSNGDLYLEGGKIFISASESDNERIIDYNGIVTCHIGTEMMAVGPSARMQDLGDAPKQSYIVIYYKDNISAGKKIELKDDNNNVILSFNPNKTYKAALITSANLEVGNNYKIVCDKKELSVSLVEGKNEIVE